MLGSAILLAAVVAAAVSFAFAYQEAKEFQDDMLRQIASIAVRPAGSAGASAPGIRAAQASGDIESQVSVLHFPGDTPPDWMTSDVGSGLHTLRSRQGDVRVFIAGRLPGERTVVAQPTEVRDELAINSALRTLVPLLLLLPVLAWLIVRIVRRELAPVIRLSQSLDEQPANRSPAFRSGHSSGADAIRACNQSLDRTGELAFDAKSQADASELTTVDVNALTRELIAEFVPVAAAKRIDLGFADVISLQVLATPELLRQVLRNALENAMNYTPRGGEVSLRIFADGSDDVIEVIDDGPGIPAAERDRVFDSFVRLPGSHGFGSGIGLAIARESATRLGAVVSLHGRPGLPGLVFRYRQPHKQDSSR
jgi:two-component system OmpR family sensor kinase